MSGCLSCSSGNYTGGMEFFTNDVNGSGGGAVYEPAPTPQHKGCSLKNQACMYTAQGVLVCGGGSKGVNNEDPKNVPTGVPLF